MIATIRVRHPPVQVNSTTRRRRRVRAQSGSGNCTAGTFECASIDTQQQQQPDYFQVDEKSCVDAGAPFGCANRVPPPPFPVPSADGVAVVVVVVPAAVVAFDDPIKPPRFVDGRTIAKLRTASAHSPQTAYICKREAGLLPSNSSNSIRRVISNVSCFIFRFSSSSSCCR